ncbi:hypothetical protein C8Q80DRAFT_114794 [Daedaleopsis nitida]|nr:hypothetical protein C8Q80DRAFT_940113 [Daedaleopsis nitida]KAI0757658.1 hypothetical protein C8Q80DRAFT_114768 [Daedaleopsis nitida]KAI0757662.1 hypothetical protein C8Q80DRAFT_114784 [Daedaleopsis nitida]KAI0757666.1 hypothetical protein C8Q80DRAFT_114794 [Daedaleopsis nitida]
MHVITISFGDLKRSKSTVHRICCIPNITINTLIRPRTKVPLFFTATGQISPRNCYLTQGGWFPTYREMPEIASFWLEERPNLASRLNWLGMGKTVKAFKDHFDSPHLVDTSHLCDLDADANKYRLQIVWEANPCQTIARSLCMYDHTGARQQVPKSLDEADFDAAYEVVFTVDYMKEEGDASIVLFASLLRMFKV